MANIQQRLQELGIELPNPPRPVASYVGWVKTAKMIYVSGQLPMLAGQPQFIGQVGGDISLEDGVKAAELCALNILAQLAQACDGNLDQIAQIVKLTGYVNSAPHFSSQPQVINGASNFMAKVFVERGIHARVAVGVSALPFGVCVEVDAIAEVF